MKFTEAQLEKAFAELLGQEGFPHSHQQKHTGEGLLTLKRFGKK